MRKITLLFLFSIHIVVAQNYTEYQTGSTTDVITNHQPGACLMGGATEQEDAMIWFLNKADGGDVVVLRASGSDGYNNYFYTDLGVTINSVTTFVIDNVAGAIDPYVLQSVENAEAIWFAGGDQYDYVSYFKDNAMEDALNNFVNVKQGVIGGTSAGLAILGGNYFSAQYGTLTNAVALSNPYHPRVAIGENDFLDIPYLNNVITDSHYDDPDRRARHSVMLARIATDNATRSFGIACNEYTAVCVEPDGKAYVYGEYPAYDEFAYFLQANCVTDFEPETCVSGSPLTWDRNNEAIKVYKVPGTESGVNYFDLSDWETGSGGEWRNWSIEAGTFTTTAGTNPLCGALSAEDYELSSIKVFPNPFEDTIQITTESELIAVQIVDILGNQRVVELNADYSIDTSSLSTGIYFLKLKTDTTVQTFKVVKR
ncbi:T9SS type A sorting domain-containing protein [Psychroserpens luteus]|uniref:T9SS type A sorting domain-containing protein n=1 Tax=Psychroserpens luteus TaxID=1434066 RepID=A0ABW5ZTB5_9FLAO|nr:T9SS type A sorting domain-containing protein [Psychroserpens luteus]